MNVDNIGSWSPAELRRFIVNLILSDPGALPPNIATVEDITNVINNSVTNIVNNINNLGWFNVKTTYGAVGDGVADDLVSITNAISAMPSTGGILYFPPGVYKITGTLNFDDTRSVMLLGTGGLDAGAGTGTRINYTGTGTAISARSTLGFSMRDLWMQMSNAAHSGTLIDMSHSSGGSDAAFGSFRSCLIGSSTPTIQGTGILVSLDNAIDISFHECNISGGNIGVRGRALIGSYSNAIQFNNCVFHYFNTMPLKNAGQAWEADGCTFEQLYPGGVSGGAGAYSADAGFSTPGPVVFSNLWCGDANATGTWITTQGNTVLERSFMGGGATAIALSASSKANIHDNAFSNVTNAIDASAGNTVLDVAGNAYTGVTNRIVLAATSTGEWFDDVVLQRTLRGGQLVLSRDTVTTSHLDVGKSGTATDGASQGAIRFTGPGVDHQFIVSIPSITAATRRISFRRAGGADPTTAGQFVALAGDDRVIFGSAEDTELKRSAASVLTQGADDVLKTGQNVTASRPAAATVGKGAQFYDTTLNIPIWSDGTNWKNAAGTIV